MRLGASGPLASKYKVQGHSQEGKVQSDKPAFKSLLLCPLALQPWLNQHHRIVVSILDIFQMLILVSDIQ